MKSYLSTITLMLTVLWATAAYPLTLDYVSDGLKTPDRLIYSAKSGSSLAAEVQLVSAGLGGIDTTNWSLARYDFGELGYIGWEQLADAPELYAFDFGTNYHPDYFLLKTGANVWYDGQEFDHFLYENLGLLQYAVVDLSVFSTFSPSNTKNNRGGITALDAGGQIDLEKISHMTVVVPEPSTLALMGFGLAGLTYITVKRRRIS